MRSNSPRVRRTERSTGGRLRKNIVWALSGASVVTFAPALLTCGLRRDCHAAPRSSLRSRRRRRCADASPRYAICGP